MPNPTAKERYNSLESSRESVLDRARAVARVTIPSLYPERGHDHGEVFTTPAQSVGSRGVNILASKLMQTLLPSVVPFFRILPSGAAKAALEDAEPEFRNALEKAMANYERVIMEDIRQKNDESVAFEAFKHLIIGGNVLLNVSKDGLRMFSLERYVVRRDDLGNQLEIVLKETFAPASLPKKILDIAANQRDDLEGYSYNKEGDSKTIDIYTRIYRDINATDTKWVVYQEVNGEEIPDTNATYAKDNMPWLALRMFRVSGEDYGRGYAEQYLGDLNSLEGLSKALIEGAAAASKILFLVKPNGFTSPRELERSDNGAILAGNSGDITVMQLDKYPDFRFVAETARNIEERLKLAFLDGTAIQRQAERVTAEEIRTMSLELDKTLGGAYSVFSKEFQLSYVKRKIALLEKEGALKPLPEKSIRIAVITGLNALGRAQEGNRLQLWLGNLIQILGPVEPLKYIHILEYMKKMAIAEGVDYEDLFKTEEEAASMDQTLQQQEMLQNISPEATKQIGSIVQKTMEQ